MVESCFDFTCHVNSINVADHSCILKMFPFKATYSAGFFLYPLLLYISLFYLSHYIFHTPNMDPVYGSPLYWYTLLLISSSQSLYITSFADEPNLYLESRPHPWNPANDYCHQTSPSRCTTDISNLTCLKLNPRSPCKDRIFYSVAFH